MTIIYANQLPLQKILCRLVGILITLHSIIAGSSLYADEPLIAHKMQVADPGRGLLPPAMLARTADDKFNPYDSQQFASLVLAARQYQEAGADAQAVELYQKAWQVSRLENGLYHESQLPVLEGMIASQISLENWQGINDHYDYMELIYRQLYENDELKLEAGLQKISSWHINAFNADLDGQRETHLRKARSILRQRLAIVEPLLPAEHPTLEYLHKGIELSEQHLALMSGRHNMIVRTRQRAVDDRVVAVLD